MNFNQQMANPNLPTAKLAIPSWTASLPKFAKWRAKPGIEVGNFRDLLTVLEFISKSF
jgi:hypothetical protein